MTEDFYASRFIRVAAGVIGCLFVFGGTVAILSLYGLVASFAPPTPFGRILIPVAGATFSLAGAAMILYGLGLPRLAFGAAAGAALAFVLSFHWIAFGPGARNFQTSMTITGPDKPGQVKMRAASELEGRIVFGIFSLAMDLAIISLVKSRLDR